MEKGSLYIVSTPIGNLGDITYRSVEVLKQVSLIAAEDTRRSKILLNHYQIETSLSSYNSHNKIKKGRQLVGELKIGNDIALVSDAGTPGISDPLYHLVQLVLEEDLNIYSLPGASAVLSALTVSGMHLARFVFEGFLPRKKGRTKRLETLAQEKRTIVIYESPMRINKTLQDLYAAMGDRKVTIAREMTKFHEEVVRGNLEQLIEESAERKWRGEITLVIEGH